MVELHKSRTVLINYEVGMSYHDVHCPRTGPTRYLSLFYPKAAGRYRLAEGHQQWNCTVLINEEVGMQPTKYSLVRER